MVGAVALVAWEFYIAAYGPYKPYISRVRGLGHSKGSEIDSIYIVNSQNKSEINQHHMLVKYGGRGGGTGNHPPPPKSPVFLPKGKSVNQRIVKHKLCFFACFGLFKTLI